jgi:hypothetical protein
MQLGEVVKNEFGDVFFSGINGDGFAHQSAQSLFERYVLPLLEQDNALYIVCGTDSGLLFNWVEQRFTHHASAKQFLFIELSEVLTCFGQLSLPAQLRVLSADQDMTALLQTVYLDYVAREQVFLVPSLALIDQHPDYVQLNQHLSQQLTRYVYERTLLVYNYLYERNIIQNLPYNHYSIKQVAQTLVQSKALVIGGGPSLDASLDWIKANQSNLIIFAAARVAKRLAEVGIRVHFFVSIDPNEDSFFNSREMLQTSYPCCLINTNYVYPSLLSQWQGQRLYIGSRYPWLSTEDDIFTLGNTVTHFALGAAVLLGARDIYLAGVDMCYRADQTHATGSAENDLGKYYIKERPQVTTYTGQLADTTVVFEEGRTLLAAQVAYCRQQGMDVRFYNLSEHAALVEGIDLYDSQQSITLPESVAQQQYEALMLAITPSLVWLKKDITITLKTVQTKRQLFSLAQKLAADGLKLVETSTHIGFSGYDKIAKIERKLADSMRENDAFLGAVGFSFFEQFKLLEQQYHDSRKDLKSLSTGDYQQFYHVKFTAFYQSLQLIIQALDGGLERLQYRKRFLEASITLDKLEQHWFSSGEPGLINEWKKWFEKEAGKANNQAAIERLDQAYQHLLTEAEGTQLHVLSANAMDIDYLVAEVLKAMQQDNMAELGQLEIAITKAVHLESDKQQVSALFSGLTALLSGDSDQALVMWADIVFDYPRLQIFVLTERLKLALLLHRYDIVEAIYVSLCLLAPVFRASFAKYYLTQKQPERALVLLQQYLVDMPDDQEARIQLVKTLLTLSEAHYQQQAQALLFELRQELPHNPELALLSKQVNLTKEGL